MLASIFPLLASLALPSTTIHVDVNNPSCPGSGTAADPFCLIRDAIGAAVDGDVIQVAPGIYREPQTHGPISFRGKAVRVVSRDGPAVTEIHSGGGIAFRFASGEGPDSRLIGFTVDGEDQPASIGVACAGASMPTLRGNVFADLETGVLCRVGSGVRSLFNSYEGSSFQGILLEGDGALELRGGKVVDCYEGVVTFRSTVDISGCSFRRNPSTTASLNGGDVTLTDCSFASGAGVFVTFSTATITRCTFRSCQLLCGFDPVTVDRCSFSDTGFPVIFTGLNEFTMTNSVIFDTGGRTSTGGIAADDSTLFLSHNTYHGNQGTGSVIHGNNNIVESRNDIYWGNEQPALGLGASTITMEHSDFEGGHPGTGNVDVDPRFVDAASDDFRLQAGSPLIDLGDPAFSSCDLDHSGGPRLLDGALDTDLRTDMGAHEFGHVELDVQGALTPGGTVTVHSTGTAGLPTLLLVSLQRDPVLHPKLGCLYPSVQGGPWRILPWPSLPSSVDFTIPPTLQVPVELHLQQFALSGSAGNGSNPVELEIE